MKRPSLLRLALLGTAVPAALWVVQASAQSVSGGADSVPVETPLREESVNGAAMPGLNGIALGDGEPTGSAKMENVMTIGNGIQLDLGAAQADRLTAAPAGSNSRESDPP